jgi:hypothetical protein
LKPFKEKAPHSLKHEIHYDRPHKEQNGHSRYSSDEERRMKNWTKNSLWLSYSLLATA